MKSTRAGTAIAAVVAVAAAVVWAVCGGQVRLPQAGKPAVSKAVKTTAPGPVQPAVRKVKTRMDFGPWAKYPGDHPGAKWGCTLWVDLTNIGRDPFGTDGASISSGEAECSIAGYGQFAWGSYSGDPTAADLPAGWTDDAKTEWLDWYAGAYASLPPAQASFANYVGTVYVATARVGTTAQYQYKCYGRVNEEMPDPQPGWEIRWGPTEWELAASIEATGVQAQARVGNASYTHRTSPRRWTDREAQYRIGTPE